MMTRVTPLLACLLACSSSPSQNNPDAGPPEGCPKTSGEVTHTGTITANETWGAGIHRVPSTLSVDGATVTVEACADVRLGKDASIEVSQAGSLVTRGEPARPVTFSREGSEPWGALHAEAPATLRLRHTNVRGGGGSETKLADAEWAGASISARSSGAVAELIAIDHVSVEGSTGMGVALFRAAFLSNSAELTVTQSGQYPVYLGLDGVQNLPSGRYTGNAKDAILLVSYAGPAVYSNDRPLLADAIMRDVGVPYRAGGEGAGVGSLQVGDGRPEGGKAKLTIQAGVTIRFEPTKDSASGLRVQGHVVNGKPAPQGALIVQGTAEKPVRFTSAAGAPGPGDWMGLYFETAVDPATKVEHAIIEYAGADSSTRGVCESIPKTNNVDADGSVILFLQNPPPSSFLSKTTLREGRGCGVYRAWNVVDVDFIQSNTFQNIEGCLQTNIPNDLNVCPTADCPKL